MHVHVFYFKKQCVYTNGLNLYTRKANFILIIEKNN